MNRACILLILGAFLLKAPFVARRTHLSPDAVAYVNVARNLSSGHGFVSTLKLYYLDGEGVRHAAMADSPPLYPMLAALILRFGGDIIALQAANTLLTCIAAGLVFLIATRLFDRRAGLLAGVAAALAPNLLRAGSIAISDALALTLALAALLPILRKDPSHWRWLAAGLLAGMAALARYPNAIVGLALTIAAFTGPNRRANGPACSLGCLLVIAPILPHLPSVQTLHYGVGSFQQSMWNPGSPVDPWFFIHHAGFVAASVLRNTLFYGVDLFTGLRGLFLLSLGLPALLLRRKAPALNREQKLILAIAAMNFAIYAATWSIPPVKGSRFLLLTYCLLLPFFAAGIVSAWDRWGHRGRAAVALACITTAAVYIWGCATAASYTLGECRPLPVKAVARITNSLPPGTAIASNNPWEVSYSTNAPTALLPRNLGPEDLRRFITHHNIGQIVLLGRCKGSRTAESIMVGYHVTRCSPTLTIALPGRTNL